MSAVWEGNWRQRIYQRLQDRGFQSLSAYAGKHPRESLLAMADDLGQDVAAIQLESILREEAQAHGMMEYFARDLLVRVIHEEIPDGWDVSERYDFWSEWASASARWSAGLEKSDEQATDRVWDAFKQMEIPKGWLPDGPDDPILCKAFAGIEFKGSPARGRRRSP